MNTGELWSHMMKSGKKKGVILLEIVTALVVLGILSSMGVPKFPETAENKTPSIGSSRAIRPEATDYELQIPSETTDGLPMETLDADADTDQDDTVLQHTGSAGEKQDMDRTRGRKVFRRPR